LQRTTFFELAVYIDTYILQNKNLPSVRHFQNVVMRIKESVFYENQENHDEKRILEFLKKILEKHF
jgi:hypothetical protein